MEKMVGSRQIRIGQFGGLDLNLNDRKARAPTVFAFEVRYGVDDLRLH